MVIISSYLFRIWKMTTYSDTAETVCLCAFFQDGFFLSYASYNWGMWWLTRRCCPPGAAVLQAYLGTCLYISHELYCLAVRRTRKYDTDTQEYQYSHQSSSLENVNRILDTLLTVRLLKTHKKVFLQKMHSLVLVWKWPSGQLGSDSLILGWLLADILCIEYRLIIGN